MAAARKSVRDSATGKALPKGVRYAGPAQYRCRPMFAGWRLGRTFENARDAAAWLEEMRVAARSSELPAAVDPTLKTTTVVDLINRFEAGVIRTPARRGGRENLGNLPLIRGKPFGDTTLAALKPEHVRTWWKTMEAGGLSGGTIKKRPPSSSRRGSGRASSSGMSLTGENPASAAAAGREGAGPKTL